MRKALGLGRVHLLGHSWGGWLGIEYALTYLGGLKSFILSDACGDMPHLKATPRVVPPIEADLLPWIRTNADTSMTYTDELSSTGRADHPQPSLCPWPWFRERTNRARQRRQSR